MIDVATNFCAAEVLINQSSKALWRTIQNLRTLVYTGPSDYLSVDQGTGYENN